MQSKHPQTARRHRAPGGRASVVSLAVASALFACAAAREVGAQGPQLVSGRVVSEDGERIVGARVLVAALGNGAALSDDDGHFELYVLGDSATRQLVVRRIGFRPESLMVRLPRDAAPPLEVRLVRLAQNLAAVVVEGDTRDLTTISAQVHERQRRAANGRFVFREDIEAMHVTLSSDVLRRVLGVSVLVGGTGRAQLRLRDNVCPPLFWLDGIPLVGAPYDVDQLPPSAIEAIEVYPSSGTVPVEFRGPMRAQGCGTIVLWTREGERRPKRPTITADSIARLVDAARVFLPQEVDSEARLIEMPQPQYPDSLYRAHAAGAVVAECIVDAGGHIVPESIGVVSSSDVRFTDAVRLALREATFHAAMKQGHAVAQVVQIPVTFKPPPSS